MNMDPSTKKAPVDRSTLYRKRLKEIHPEKYNNYLKNQRERSKARRSALKQDLKKRHPCQSSIEKQNRNKELQRERQRRYLKRKKDMKENDASQKRKIQQDFGEPPPKRIKTSDIKTRKSLKEKREYNRRKKQASRARMSSQKKTWERKKDRERKAKKTAEKKASKNMLTIWNFNTPHQRVRKEKEQVLQDRRQEQVATEGSLQNDGTPAKESGEPMENKTPKTQPAKQNPSRPVQKLLAEETKSHLNSLTRVAKAVLNHSKKYIVKSTVKRKSGVDEKGIKLFYQRPDVSRLVPLKRYATKDGPGYLMQISVSAAWAKYNDENKSKKVSLGKFASLRPRNIRKLSTKHREYCVCVYCTNIRYKLLTLGKEVPDLMKKLKTNETELASILLCEKPHNEKFHNPACLQGNCKNCSDYLNTLKTYYGGIPPEKVLKWQRWEKRASSYDGKMKRILVTKTGDQNMLLEEFVTDITKPAQGTNFFLHIHTAFWQNEQFSFLKRNLPEAWTLKVMDFAKNRGIKYQDEIKSVFYSNEQVTLHPVITYYNGEEGVVRESSVVICEDTNHDYHAVKHFQAVVDQHIATRLTKSCVRKVIFSDGCSAQYKSKGPFADLYLEKTSATIDRNFFGSEHGKADCDAEIGVTNKAIDQAIIGRKAIINNAEDMFKFCTENLRVDEKFLKREFFPREKGRNS